MTKEEERKNWYWITVAQTQLGDIHKWNTLRWFGPTERMNEDWTTRWTYEERVNVRKWKKRLKKIWLDKVGGVMKEKWEI